MQSRYRSEVEMCLAVPMEVVRIEGRTGMVHSAGVELQVALDFVEDTSVGDYVIVHAGYAMQRMSPADAKESLAILERLLGDDGE